MNAETTGLKRKINRTLISQMKRINTEKNNF